MLILSVTLTYLVLTRHLIFSKNQAGSQGQHVSHALKTKIMDEYSSFTYSEYPESYWSYCIKQKFCVFIDRKTTNSHEPGHFISKGLLPAVILTKYKLGLFVIPSQ